VVQGQGFPIHLPQTGDVGLDFPAQNVHDQGVAQPCAQAAGNALIHAHPGRAAIVLRPPGAAHDADVFHGPGGKGHPAFTANDPFHGWVPQGILWGQPSDGHDSSANGWLILPFHQLRPGPRCLAQCLDSITGNVHEEEVRRVSGQLPEEPILEGAVHQGHGHQHGQPQAQGKDHAGGHGSGAMQVGHGLAQQRSRPAWAVPGPKATDPGSSPSGESGGSVEQDHADQSGAEKRGHGPDILHGRGH